MAVSGSGRSAGRALLAVLVLLALVEHPIGQPATSYIIDNPAPSGDFGAAFAAKMRPAASFPGAVSGILLPPDWAASLMADGGLLPRLGRRVALGRHPPAD